MKFEKHDIPLGTLVEVLPNRRKDDSAGLRLYVVAYGHDHMFGTALYNLSLSKNAKIEIEKYESALSNVEQSEENEMKKIMYFMARGSMRYEFTRKMLKVVN